LQDATPSGPDFFTLVRSKIRYFTGSIYLAGMIVQKIIWENKTMYCFKISCHIQNLMLKGNQFFKKLLIFLNVHAPRVERIF